MAKSGALDPDAVARFSEAIPHIRALGATVVTAGGGFGKMRLKWRPEFVGDTRTGVLHGGVVTTLLDNASGIAVFSALTEIMQVATLDLRIDYLKPAEPEVDLVAEATCYKVTRHIAFVRGRAYQEPGGDVATSSASFMLASSPVPGGRRRKGAP